MPDQVRHDAFAYLIAGLILWQPLILLKAKRFRNASLFTATSAPGLALGYRSATAGMAWLDERRSEDEEVVAIVETDACSTDAVQVLTGCTFGKGNFIY